MEIEITKCECGNHEWVQAHTLGMVPAVLSENGKAGFAPVNITFICLKCGKGLEETKEFKEMMAEAPSPIIRK